MSLIDNINQTEILYMSVTSSSINWGEKPSKKNKVFKAYPTHKIVRIEEEYQKYLMIKDDLSAKNQISYKNFKINDDDEVCLNFSWVWLFLMQFLHPKIIKDWFWS